MNRNFSLNIFSIHLLIDKKKTKLIIPQHDLAFNISISQIILSTHIAIKII